LVEVSLEASNKFVRNCKGASLEFFKEVSKRFVRRSFKEVRKMISKCS